MPRDSSINIINNADPENRAARPRTALRANYLICISARSEATITWRVRYIYYVGADLPRGRIHIQSECQFLMLYSNIIDSRDLRRKKRKLIATGWLCVCVRVDSCCILVVCTDTRTGY